MQVRDYRLPWWTVILVLVNSTDCSKTASIQRRFMWKQMDDTMDGLMDSVASSARAMKNMFGDLMPGISTAPTPLLMHGNNVLDFLPSETTKVKYIIRTPATHKPMKIIKMSAPKKVVKIMTVSKPIVENNFGKSKSNFPSAEALRQMEREQEMLAEGHLPHYNSDSSKDHNNVVKGKINEFGGEWRPVSTPKPHTMSELHTSIVGETLPLPEKVIYEPQANEVSFDYHKKHANYEVTEHSPEESVAVAYAQPQYHNSRGFLPLRSTHSSSLSTSSSHHSIIHQPQVHHQHQHNARVGLPHATAAVATTTTTESPNYPLSYLKKQRERPTNLLQQHLKNLGLNDSDGGLVSSKPPKTQQKAPTLVRVKSESWPLLGPTILPSAVAPNTTPRTRKAEPLIQPTIDEHLRQRSTTTKKPANSKPRDLRQRGSIKFGDKLTEFY